MDSKAAVNDGGITPSADCDKYLDCLSAATPEAFPAALQVYKADGPCWANAAAATKCERACQEGYSKLAAAYTTVAECGGKPSDLGVGTGKNTGEACQSDAECADGKCLVELVLLGTKVLLPGGYCSGECSNKACAAGEQCWTSTDGDGKEIDRVCLKTCTTEADCDRGGYTYTSGNLCLPK
jgi:hypothetical protein